ncbi:MAG TPA: sodium-translocating pyrophosphatase [Bacteroidales bacterium]|nr:sodium-translocating pyrophosphatase [Bacteroidales bacterium]HRZ48669.1 sodium-translocating pyrophosphatase [Bacteroidales bacterium]
MISLPGASPFEVLAIWCVLVIAFFGLAYAMLLRRQVMACDKGSAKMQEVWNGIRSGADAYLKRQLRTIIPLILVFTVVLFFSVYVVPPTAESRLRFEGYSDQSLKLIIGAGRAVAFIMGSVFSLMVGQFGMRMAVQANVRVASASGRSFTEALKIAYRAGTVTGMLTDGLGLLGGTLIFIIFGVASPDTLLGFGFGGTLLALFMRVGGGIYTKAADVGADLVGKVEAGLPEDDERNAAVVADLVGDNVGDCAGMAADIFESYEVTIVSTLILGVVLFTQTHELSWIIFPLLVRGIGVLSSIIGTYLVRGGRQGKNHNALKSINKGFYSSAAISVFSFGLISYFYLNDWRSFFSVVAGILLAIVLDEITKRFTDGRFRPVKDIARSSRTGSATLILKGLSYGFEVTVWQTLVIAITIFLSILIYHGQPVVYVLYGVAMTGIGMLTLTGNNVAMDAFGPIADNANGIGELSHLDKDARKIMDSLDATGNTTKAITKGVAIGSAVIAAVALFGSFITDVSKVQIQMGIEQSAQLIETGIRISVPVVFIGLLIGGTIPFLFSSLTINAVTRAASQIVEEVRRQFRIPGIIERKVKPDYQRAVDICTVSAQRELVPLALISVLSPIIIGSLLGVEALGGFLAGVILSGQLLAVFMADAGGAWDNAKKTIEDGLYGGKGSEAHHAAVVGDTVGDPLKDTAGPALNPMIKVINLVSLLAAPVIMTFRKPGHLSAGLVITGVICLVLVIGAIAYSKRSSETKPVREI